MATAQPKPGTASGAEPELRDYPLCETNSYKIYGSCLEAISDDLAMVTDTGGHGLYSFSYDYKTEDKRRLKDKEREIIGLIRQQDNEVLVLRKDGYISKYSLHDGESTTHWRVEAEELVHGAALGRQLLVCLDGKRKEVFMVTLQPDGTVHKRVKLQGQDIENARVACTGVDDGVRIAILKLNLHHVEVYNAKWKLHTTISGQGAGFDPQDCIFLPWGNLLVADTNNDRVSEYRPDGQNELVRHWLTSSCSTNGTKPRVISFLSPNLWLLNKMLNDLVDDDDRQLNCISKFIIFKK